MTKRIPNLHRTMLLSAALAATAAPALAADLKTGDLCEKKVASGSWHECGTVPNSGHINHMNTGTHNVTVFTTGPDGAKGLDVVWGMNPVGDHSDEDLERWGVLQIQRDLPPKASSQTDVGAGQLVYIARSDHMATDRTIAISLDHVPYNPIVRRRSARRPPAARRGGRRHRDKEDRS